MKRLFALLLALCVVLFAGCNSHKTSKVEITCADVIAAYEAQGFNTFHIEERPEMNMEYNCYIKVTHDDLDGEMYLHFFNSHEEAVAYIDEAPYATIGIGLFSLIWGQPTWVEFETYNQISIEYSNAKLYKPFKQLIKDKQ